jgi:hypothetical protein
MKLFRLIIALLAAAAVTNALELGSLYVYNITIDITDSSTGGEVAALTVYIQVVVIGDVEQSANTQVVVFQAQSVEVDVLIYVNSQLQDSVSTTLTGSFSNNAPLSSTTQVVGTYQ